MSNGVTGLDWVEVLSLDEFRRFTERFNSHQLAKLRQQLIEKAQAIVEELSVPPSRKMNRDGYPMLQDEYQGWHARASKALACTEAQIAHVNQLKWDATASSVTPQVLRRVLDLAEQGADFASTSVEDRNALKIFAHYIGGL